MTTLAQWLRWLLWPFRRREYVHPEPHSCIVMDLDAAKAVVEAGHFGCPAIPGTTLVAVMSADGRAIAEFLVTID